MAGNLFLMRRILISTGNGMFGHALIEQLLNRDDIEVRAMVRDTAAFTLTAPNLSVVQADMDDPATLVEPTKDITHMFLTTPMDEHIATREIAMIDAAAANGTPHVLIIAGAVDHKDDHLAQLHEQSRAHLQASGLPWTMISPTSVIETVMNPIREQMGMGLWLGTSGHGKAALVAVGDVGRVMAVVATTDGHEAKNYVCTGPELIDMGQIATLLSDKFGREIVYLDIPEDDMADMLVKHAGYKDREAVEIGVLCHFRAWREGRAEALTDTVEQLTGQQAQSVSSWLDDHLAEFSVKPSMSERIGGFALKQKYRGDAMTD